MSSRTRARLGSGAYLLKSDEDSEAEGAAGGAESADEGDKGEWIGSMSKSKKVRYVCLGNNSNVCGIVIKDSDDSIRCDGCEGWFNQKCQELSAEAETVRNFKALVKFDFTWLCDDCKSSLSPMIQLGKRLETRVEVAEQKILSVLKQYQPKQGPTKQLESKITSMEKIVMGKIREHQEKVTTLQQQSKAAEVLPKYTSEINKYALDLKKR